MGNVVLSFRRKVARGFKGLVEKFCHGKFTIDNPYIIMRSAC